MRIRMRWTETVSMDGVNFGRLEAGAVRDLPSSVATTLVSGGQAIALLQNEGREVTDRFLSPAVWSPVEA
jgi:hypothetical protein